MPSEYYLANRERILAQQRELYADRKAYHQRIREQSLALLREKRASMKAARDAKKAAKIQRPV